MCYIDVTLHVAQCDLMCCNFISRPYNLHLCNSLTLLNQINESEMLNCIAGDVLCFICGTLLKMSQLH